MQPATHSRLRSNSIVSPLSGTYPGISSSLRSLAVLLPGMTLSPILGILLARTPRRMERRDTHCNQHYHRRSGTELGDAGRRDTG